MKKKSVLPQLFFSTLYLSAFTFGGGYVIVSLMKKRFVDERHWIGEDEMLDLVAIAQSSPGPIAVNGAIVVGYKLAGLAGGTHRGRRHRHPTVRHHRARLLFLSAVPGQRRGQPGAVRDAGRASARSSRRSCGTWARISRGRKASRRCSSWPPPLYSRACARSMWSISCSAASRWGRRGRCLEGGRPDDPAAAVLELSADRPVQLRRWLRGHAAHPGADRHAARLARYGGIHRPCHHLADDAGADRHQRGRHSSGCAWRGFRVRWLRRWGACCRRACW